MQHALIDFLRSLLAVYTVASKDEGMQLAYTLLHLEVGCREQGNETHAELQAVKASLQSQLGDDASFYPQRLLETAVANLESTLPCPLFSRSCMVLSRAIQDTGADDVDAAVADRVLRLLQPVLHADQCGEHMYRYLEVAKSLACKTQDEKIMQFLQKLCLGLSSMPDEIVDLLLTIADVAFQMGGDDELSESKAFCKAVFCEAMRRDTTSDVYVHAKLCVERYPQAKDYVNAISDMVGDEDAVSNKKQEDIDNLSQEKDCTTEVGSMISDNQADVNDSKDDQADLNDSEDDDEFMNQLD